MNDWLVFVLTVVIVVSATQVVKNQPVIAVSATQVAKNPIELPRYSYWKPHLHGDMDYFFGYSNMQSRRASHAAIHHVARAVHASATATKLRKDSEAKLEKEFEDRNSPAEAASSHPSHAAAHTAAHTAASHYAIHHVSSAVHTSPEEAKLEKEFEDRNSPAVAHTAVSSAVHTSPEEAKLEKEFEDRNSPAASHMPAPINQQQLQTAVKAAIKRKVHAEYLRHSREYYKQKRDQEDRSGYHSYSMNVYPGYRAWLSFAGILIIVFGGWAVERAWDERGSAAFTKAAKERGKTSETLLGKPVHSTVSVDNPQLYSDLYHAQPWPLLPLIGWCLLGVAYMYTDSDRALFSRPKDILCLCLCISIGLVAFPVANSTRTRSATNKWNFAVVHALLTTGLAVLGSLNENYTLRNQGVNMSFCLIGTLFMFVAKDMLWKYRKMGYVWEVYGMPNPEPVVFNMGGPLLLLGALFFWLGMVGSGEQRDADNYSTGNDLELEWMNCISYSCGIPLFFNLRSLFCFGCGLLMVPAYFCLEHAFDEGGEVGPSYIGTGTDGVFMGKFLESPIPTLWLWIMFGFSAFIQIDSRLDHLYATPRPWVLLVLCLLGGLVELKARSAFYKRDSEGKQLWMAIFAALVIVLAVMIGVSDSYNRLNADSLSLPLALVAALCLILAKRSFSYDRKVAYIKPEGVSYSGPIVYSAGPPLFALGWFLLSWAMSLDW